MKTHMTNSPAAIAIAKDITALDKKYEPLINDIKKRYEIELNKLKRVYDAEHQALWRELTDKMDLPTASYDLDDSYADHGVIFLKENQLEDDDVCDCQTCVDRRARGEPKPSLAEILAQALGQKVN
jgi:hypothetical protein